MNTIERLEDLTRKQRDILFSAIDCDSLPCRVISMKERQWFISNGLLREFNGVNHTKWLTYTERGAELVADYQQRQQMASEPSAETAPVDGSTMAKQVTDMLSEKDTVIGKMALDHVQLETELTAAKRRIAELEHQVKIADGVFERLGRYEEALRYIANGTLFGKTPKELANIALKGSQS